MNTRMPRSCILANQELLLIYHYRFLAPIPAKQLAQTHPLFAAYSSTLYQKNSNVFFNVS